MKVSIRISVDEKGNAQMQREGATALEASIILTQLAVQLQVQAHQQAGGSVIQIAPTLPGIRLS